MLLFSEMNEVTTRGTTMALLHRLLAAYSAPNATDTLYAHRTYSSRINSSVISTMNRSALLGSPAVMCGLTIIADAPVLMAMRHNLSHIYASVLRLSSSFLVDMLGM
jgi:hypothetical protein